MSLNFLSKSLHTKDGSNRYVILQQYTLITIGGFSQFKQEKQLNLVTEMTIAINFLHVFPTLLHLASSGTTYFRRVSIKFYV